VKEPSRSGRLPDSVRVYVEYTETCRNWNEDQVADWLRRINCAQYIDLFKSEYDLGRLPLGNMVFRNYHPVWEDDYQYYCLASTIHIYKGAGLIRIYAENNITGEILMEMDQPSLKEMGIKKIGDRVRIGSQAKLFRNREYSKPASRTSNRV
jgi:mitogen-activated protein kinase kinase kinase